MPGREDAEKALVQGRNKGPLCVFGAMAILRSVVRKPSSGGEDGWSPTGDQALGGGFRVSTQTGASPRWRAVWPPGGRGHKRFLHRLTGEGGGAHEVEVEIDGDAFRLDDHRLAHLLEFPVAIGYDRGMESG